MKQGVKEAKKHSVISEMTPSSSDSSFEVASKFLCHQSSQLWCCKLLPLFLNICMNFTRVCTATREDVINC